ncbi:MAG: COG4223 family protein [Beijerinckiaceae bacterium]
MVDQTGTESSSKTELATGPTSLRHEKPVIEGEVISTDVAVPEPRRDAAASDGQDAAAAAMPAADEPAPDPIAESSSASAEEPEIRRVAPDEVGARRRRLPIWPIAAAAVIGAGLAVGGTFYLRSFDTTSESIAALTARETEFVARLAALEKKPDAGIGLRDTVAAQEKRIAAAEAAAREAVATAKSALAAAETRSASAPSSSLPEAAGLASLATRVNELDRRLADLDQKLAQLSPPIAPKSDLRVQPGDTARSDAEAVAIIAESLVGKIERGLPYAPELAALANRGVDKSKFAALEPMAETGVASGRALASRFAALSDSLLAPEPLKVEGTILERMVQSAGRLVRIRKVGDTSADDLPARIGRINGALQAGAVEEALAQWNDLPAPTKAKSQDFAMLAKARVDAVAAARALQSEAIAALGRTKS